nr:MAG: chaperone of endosialidase [Bacteriophage sp.]
MTGTLTVGDTSTSATVATIKSSNASGTYIQFVNGTTPTVEVGYHATYGAYLYNDKLDSHPTLCLGLADNLREAIIYRYAGVNYNVWHSGSLKPYQFTGWSDARSVNHVPNDYNGLFIMRGIKKLTTIGLSDSGAYATVWGWRGWADSTGGQAWEIASTNEDLYTRHGHTTSWSSWAKILNSSNYKDYMHDRFGTSGLIVYSTTSNEINFGGTYTDSSNIYFGYNSKDNRPRPTEYHFGQNDASLHGKYFQSHIPTGTQPFQCVSTTTCTNLNADMVDGYHSNDLTKRVFINGIPGGAGAKWIRIGVLKYPSAGDSNTVMITISNSYSYSMNRSVTFIISLTHHASKPIITQLNGYPAPFTAVRILAPKDSNGSYTYGDRYVDIRYATSAASGASNTIYLTAINLNYNGTYTFIPNKSFVDGTTIPSNYGEIWNFPFMTGLGSNANIYSQDGLIEGGTLKLSSTSTFGGEATFNGGMYSGNIFPLSNNNYRIGSSSNRFIDAYIQTWVYANSGLYMNPSGITQNGSYLELSSGGNEIIIAGGTDFYVNYRGASYGGRSVPKKWYWRAGSGSSWANMEFGDCTLHGWINSTGISASGANSFNVGARFSNTSNDSIEIVGGNYTMGLGCHSNGSWFWWRGTANPTISTNKSYVMAYDGSTWAFTGSITATAAITAKATSDFRLKENYDGLIDYRERLLKLGRVYDYNYNKKALDLYQDRIDNKRHTGLVYQNAVKAGITNFCHEKDEYGYGSLNYLSPDLIATIIGSVQANILSIRLVESEQERMRKELEHAKSEINRLKGLVASLQN